MNYENEKVIYFVEVNEVQKLNNIKLKFTTIKMNFHVNKKHT